MSKTIHPVVLCGGSGTRLWPLSKQEKPKQFQALISEHSMLHETASRFSSSKNAAIEFGQILVVGSAQHERLLSETLPNARKILEPFGRNSAPAVAAASLAFAPDDLVLIVSADHSIQDVQAFHDAISMSVSVAEQGSIVTFGIQPTYPATGYGYIKTGKRRGDNAPVKVDEFVEKPPLDLAEAYLEAGNYFWNGGIFLFRADTMIDALEVHGQQILSNVRAAMGDVHDPTINLDGEKFAQSPSISIDFAVMEKASNVFTVPVDMGWDDVGGYQALYNLLSDSKQQNVLSGPVLIRDSNRLYVRSEGPLIAVSGVNDLAIVATDDEIMIAPLNDGAAVKDLRAQASAYGNHRVVPPELIEGAQSWLWGAFELWSEKAWDDEAGGFVERLTLDGEPDHTADRRVRVQARQVYSFAKALEMGAPNADRAHQLVINGLDHLDQCLRHAQGGWVHTIAADGSVLDDRRDLYDHAFIILAGAAAHQAIGHPRALKIADDAFEFIDSCLKDPLHGGWVECRPESLPRRSNPHMHLLEASLAYYEATGSNAALDRAGEIVELFEIRFFDPKTDVMAEHFSFDWQTQTSDSGVLFEPGHHYEWASLLNRYAEITGHECESWQRRLIAAANKLGRDPISELAVNQATTSGIHVNANARLWPQLEMFRATMLHPSFAKDNPLLQQFRRLEKHYLRDYSAGLWNDEVSPNQSAISNHVPASMLYHFVTAFEPLFKR